MNRQQARAEQRRIDKHIEKMQKLQSTTEKLVELGVLKKKKLPIKQRIVNFFKGAK